jgi:hypothetical protein
VTLQFVVVAPLPTVTVPAVNESAVLVSESLNNAVVPHAAKPNAPAIRIALKRYREPERPLLVDGRVVFIAVYLLVVVVITGSDWT